MKIRTDIVRMYKDVHTWVGIVSGLCLFIAFYAGAITMFEVPLQRWASAPIALSAPPPPMERAGELVEKTIAAHPEAAKAYRVVVATGPEQPARMIWRVERPEDEHHHAPDSYFASTLRADGSVEVVEQPESPVAQFVDVLHQQVGLPLDHEIAMPIMGAISLLYFVALVSGVIVLLPSLVKDLFVLRAGKNLKRMWLDVHNVLGVFSLPFHIIMALTAIVFAYHDQFYDAQGAAFSKTDVRAERGGGGPAPEGALLAPHLVVQSLAAQAPDFEPQVLLYSTRPNGAVGLRVQGVDPRHGLRGPTFGVAGVDPYSGKIVMSDYLPGQQSGLFATITSFFALHFGNFGGAPVRWGYFLLGLAGAFLFYSGNLLWVESCRKKERKAGAVVQSRAVRFMGNLTVGVTLGTIAGISLTISGAKWLPAGADFAFWHSLLFYGLFLAAIGWAFARGAARASVDLLRVSAATTLLIPLTSLAAASGVVGAWNHGGDTRCIDITALVGAAAFLWMARLTRRRVTEGPKDSICAAPSKAGAKRDRARLN